MITIKTSVYKLNDLVLLRDALSIGRDSLPECPGDLYSDCQNCEAHMVCGELSRAINYLDNLIEKEQGKKKNK